MGERIQIINLPGLYGIVQSLNKNNSNRVQISLLGKP
jgi:hypothetical protein